MAQLQDLFSTHAIIKILDFLTLYKDFEYTRTDIAIETGISRRTLYQVFPILEKFDLVKITRSCGQVKFYKLNTENPISRGIIALADEIAFYEAGKTAGMDLSLERSVPASTFQAQPEESMRMTFMKIRMEGTPSQMKKVIGEIDYPYEETQIPFQTSTELRIPGTIKRKQQTSLVESFKK